MLVRVDPTRHAPLHSQIAGQVRAAIANGDVSEGERLPSVRALAESLGVNMHTVLRAYKDLDADGLLHLRQGRGATVTSGSRRRARELHDLVARTLAGASKRGVTAAQLAALVEGEL